MLRTEFGETAIVVGKGGANTCFWQINDNDRHIGFPNKLIGILQRLARQEHLQYRVTHGDSCFNTLSCETALGKVPKSGAFIEGFTEKDGWQRAYNARSSITGDLRWLAVKRGSVR